MEFLGHADVIFGMVRNVASMKIFVFLLFLFGRGHRHKQFSPCINSAQFSKSSTQNRQFAYKNLEKKLVFFVLIARY